VTIDGVPWCVWVSIAAEAVLFGGLFGAVVGWCLR
jgi:hypothetical protein